MPNGRFEAKLMYGLRDADLTYQQIMNMPATREAALSTAIAAKTEQYERSGTPRPCPEPIVRTITHTVPGFYNDLTSVPTLFVPAFLFILDFESL